MMIRYDESLSVILFMKSLYLCLYYGLPARQSVLKGSTVTAVLSYSSTVTLLCTIKKFYCLTVFYNQQQHLLSYKDASSLHDN